MYQLTLFEVCDVSPMNLTYGSQFRPSTSFERDALVMTIALWTTTRPRFTDKIETREREGNQERLPKPRETRTNSPMQMHHSVS